MSRRRRAVVDRRPIELVNQYGNGPTLLVRELPAWAAGLFDAQLRLWRAACAYERAVNLNVTYGIPVRPGTRIEWELARAAWHPWLRMLQHPRTTAPYVALPVREDLL